MEILIRKPNIRLPPLPTVRDLVKLYKLQAIKKLSQNFLMDERICDKIVKAAGPLQNHYVCEVGPGPGSITRSIIKKCPSRLLLVEKDPRFLPTLELLQESCKGFTKIDIIIADIRDCNFENSLQGAPKKEWFDKPPPINLIGNLPFNVSTNLIIKWLKAISQQSGPWSFGRSHMTLTFQKEVAERIVASAGHDQRCRLSVMCQFWCNVHHVFNIAGKSFVPKPEVDVGVVSFEPLKKPVVDISFEFVEKVIRNIFNMRQKYAIRGAERLFPKNMRSELPLKLFHLADVDPTSRPYQITNEEFGRLCYAHKILCEESPGLINYDSRIKGNDMEIIDIDVQL